MASLERHERLRRRSHLTCSDGVTWHAELVAMRPGEMDRRVDLADLAEAAG